MPENRRYPSRPFAAVGVVVWKDDKILVIKRAKPPRAGQWGLIGGAVEAGETHFAAAMREAQEETGLIIAPFGIITAIDSITKDAAGKTEYHYSITEVNARWVSGEPIGNEEIIETQWIAPEEVDVLPVWDEMKRVVRLARQQYQAAR